MSVAIASLAVFAASQVGSPGPANMILMATGARFGVVVALPFVAGVILSKQLIIWPLGLGLMQVAETAPGVFAALKWISAAYVLWLAWRIAGSSLSPKHADEQPPGFFAGLLVHPLNPKAWAMVIAAFTGFVAIGTPVLQATATIAICFGACQVLLHPLWTLAGDRVATVLAGRPGEKYLMWSLSGLTVLSVMFVVFLGGSA